MKYKLIETIAWNQMVIKIYEVRDKPYAMARIYSATGQVVQFFSSFGYVIAKADQIINVMRRSKRAS